ncbi:HD-like signal output (HDOD) protein [Oxalobacteraceae bacterium GrIS 1.11]
MNSSAPSSQKEFTVKLLGELASKVLIFPTSLVVTMNIRRALGVDVEKPVAEVARLVSCEPVLSAQMLRASNSAAYNAGGNSISDLTSAITRLGFSVVRNITIWVGMQQLKQHCSHGDNAKRIDQLWMQTMRVAAMSCVLAKQFRNINADTAMLAGLLLNVGKFYILNRARQYNELLADQSKLWEVIDQWHVPVGSAVLENWLIPEDIHAAFTNSRHPEAALGGPVTLTDVIIVADFLITLMNLPQDRAKDVAEPLALKRLNLDGEKTSKQFADKEKELALLMGIAV